MFFHVFLYFSLPNSFWAHNFCLKSNLTQISILGTKEQRKEKFYCLKPGNSKTFSNLQPYYMLCKEISWPQQNAVWSNNNWKIFFTLFSNQTIQNGWSQIRFGHIVARKHLLISSHWRSFFFKACYLTIFFRLLMPCPFTGPKMF